MQTPDFDLLPNTDLLVLGVGNILWADEGFGVRCAEKFNELYRMPEGTRIADGGTLGMYLLEIIGNTKDLLLFDCADLHSEPGTLCVLKDDEVTKWSTTKLSAHQTGLNEVLAIAELQGKAPRRIAVIAVQPQELQDYGGSLTEVCAAQLVPACQAALGVLEEWGYKLEKRPEGEVAPRLGDEALDRTDYETHRPSKEDAPRSGDVRFFPKFD